MHRPKRLESEQKTSAILVDLLFSTGLTPCMLRANAPKVSANRITQIALADGCKIRRQQQSREIIERPMHHAAAKYLVWLMTGLLAAIQPAAAGGLSFLPDRDDAYLTFYLDNDLFAGTDSNYTNGVRLSWVSGTRDPEAFGAVQHQLRKLSGDADSRAIFQRLSGFEDPGEVEYNYGFSLTQLMFTPEDTHAPVAPPGQRPYAGWLGIDFSLHTKDAHAINSVVLAIGTTGPNALAKQTQDFVHNIRGIDKFQGWDSQVPNELTVNLYYKQKRRLTFLETGLGNFAVDGFGEWQVALGNFLVAAQMGALLRFGWNLPVDFSDPRLSVTAYTLQPFATRRRQQRSWSLYGLAGALGAAVAHNITLDGPVFRDHDTGVTGEPFVGELYVGFGIRYRRMEFGYIHTFRSKEFSEQESAQRFGSIAVTYRF